MKALGDGEPGALEAAMNYGGGRGRGRGRGGRGRGGRGYYNYYHPYGGY